MNTEQLSRDIDDVDMKIAILLAQKKDLQKKKNDLLPNAFQVMKTNSKKRKISVLDDEDVKELIKVLPKSLISNKVKE